MRLLKIFLKHTRHMMAQRYLGKKTSTYVQHYDEEVQCEEKRRDWIEVQLETKKDGKIQL